MAIAAPPGLRAWRTTVCAGILLAAISLSFLGPPGFRLPLLSMLVLGAAGAAVFFAVWKRRHGTDGAWWDVAGWLTFIGFAAALIADPEYALPALESQASRR